MNQDEIMPHSWMWIFQKNDNDKRCLIFNYEQGRSHW